MCLRSPFSLLRSWHRFMLAVSINVSAPTELNAFLVAARLGCASRVNIDFIITECVAGLTLHRLSVMVPRGYLGHSYGPAATSNRVSATTPKRSLNPRFC
jgi:hypothetical protein